MLVIKHGHGLCSINEDIYSVGGYGSAYLSDCEKYDISKDQWNTLPSLINSRYYCTCFSSNDKELYSLGGSNGTTYWAELEKLSLETQSKWEQIQIKNSLSARCYLHSCYTNKH